MSDLILFLGGPAKVARMLGIKAPSVIGWRGKPPAERCPAIERAMLGAVSCERMRPDIRWLRVPDADWPHLGGRPCIDVAGAAGAAAGDAQRQTPATPDVTHAE